MINVAIVEDVAELRGLWVDMLNDTEGYACVGDFGNLTDAILHLPKVKADVVLMDIQLSETETGIDVIRQIRTQCLDSQFLMFTIFENDAAIFESLKAGASGYILKNTPPQKVLAAIKELHEGGSPMSGSIARRVLQTFQVEKEATQYNSSKMTENGLTDGHTEVHTDEHPHLHPQERRILALLAKGFLYKEVADELSLTINTVKQYCHSIYQKLAVSNRTEAVNTFFKS
jgi:DNA-binding NarL/FixJ family response regulator